MSPLPEVLPPEALGWRSLLDAPQISPAVKGEINILQEMRPMDGYCYKDTKGEILNVVMYRYPMGAITKFTQHRGQKKKDEKTRQMVDTREYKTPYEGMKANCFISYRVDDGFDYDVDNNPTQKVKHLQCLPSEFAKKVGWKKGDGLLIGEKIPDTTPKPDLVRQEEEIARVKAERAVREAQEKK